MELHQIETWALRVVEAVNSKHPNEDARVELKGEWPEPVKAARRIAAHANAARGAPILWLIGIDEAQGVVGANYEDLASWWRIVQSQFDGTPPQLVDINVSHEERTIAALYFETTRAPFVVRNRGGGSPEREVPWRDGTRTRSAYREELLQVLSPLAELPEFEVMSAEVRLDRNPAGDAVWILKMRLYVTTLSTHVTVIPFHRCRAMIEVPDKVEAVEVGDIVLYPPTGLPSRRPRSLTIDATNNEVLIRNAGKMFLKGSAKSKLLDLPHLAGPALVSLELRPANSNRPITVVQELKWLDQGVQAQRGTARWAYTIPRYEHLLESGDGS